MAQIGCLGDIPFMVGPDAVKTPSNVQWHGSARYGEHQRHLFHALTEFTGLDPDKMSFNIYLAAGLGVDVMAELGKLWAYERGAAALTLVIGEKIYGKHRWNIKGHKISMKYFDAGGNVAAAEVSLSLVEYLDF